MNKINHHRSHKASCLAVLGTGSDVGKSVVTTAICRILAQKGIKVCPFKAQNMSNNSGVTPEGLEMGRAQIVQAEAAKIAPHVDMNPVLLKPTGETGSQVVVLGKAVGNQTAKDYYQKKKELFSIASRSLDRLRSQYDAVIMEGAGSCAEVNLMEHDMVNLRMAEYADAPVLLVADIHKGGVFAQIVGTLECLDQRRRDQIAGFMINRFRGDIGLFHEGEQWIEKKPGKKHWGSCHGSVIFELRPKIPLLLSSRLQYDPKTLNPLPWPLSVCPIYPTLRILILYMPQKDCPYIFSKKFKNSNLFQQSLFPVPNPPGTTSGG